MKIGIVTYYQVHNHGAILQMYAMSKILSDYTNDINIVKFKRNFENVSSKEASKYVIRLQSLIYFTEYILKFGIGRFLYNLSKKRKLSKFSKDNFKYVSESDICDLYCVGSDEIFSTELGFNSIAFGINSTVHSLFSYAASFGPTTYNKILNSNYKDRICSGLSAFSHLSVRDENSFKILKSLDIKEKIEQIIDPVLLFNFKEELENTTRFDFKKKYLLLYVFDTNLNRHHEISAIKEYAKLKDLIIISLGFYHKWCDKNISANPLELINIFSQAEYIITDTYHGSILSIITNRPFITKLRGNEYKIKPLLKDFRLQDRLFDDNLQINTLLEQDINYKVVNRILDEKRLESRKYLNDVFQSWDIAHER